jgi:transcriptional regulator PpsR
MDSKSHDPGVGARLSALAPELASTVVRVAGDIALVIGADGVIISVAAGNLPLAGPGQEWVGRSWADTVCTLNRSKAEQLLREATQLGVSRRREFNHPLEEGGEIPVSWAAVRLGEQGPLLAVGRDLRAVSAIQQRFLDAQKDLERDYWQRRNAETQYRLLFQVAHDGVVVLDADTRCVLDANPAALALLGHAGPTLAGQVLGPFIEAGWRPVLDELLVTALATGRAAEMRLRAAGSGVPLDVSATPFVAHAPAGAQRCVLLRVRRAEPSAQDAPAVVDFIGLTPDAVVVTDGGGRLLWANPAFLELCQANDDRRLKGRHVAELLGDPQRQWAPLLARVRARGIVGRAALSLGLPGAAPLAAEVSGALLAEGDQEHIGFTLRLLPGTPGERAAQELALDVSALTTQIGHAPLAELLAEASRRIETHFIQAALRAAGGHLDIAAAALRLSAPALLARMGRLGVPVPNLMGPDGLPPQVN